MKISLVVHSMVKRVRALFLSVSLNMVWVICKKAAVCHRCTRMCFCQGYKCLFGLVISWHDIGEAFWKSLLGAKQNEQIPSTIIDIVCMRGGIKKR